jgi:MOSC domain-containing protein YiiM
VSENPLIHSIFTGQPKTITDAQGIWTSSIFRDQVSGPVQVETGGLAGDRPAQPYHGGPDGAICVHLYDHYRFWNRKYGMDLQPGNVGENFTLDHILEEDVCAGDIIRAGTARVQVSGPRSPCANQARRVGRRDWVKLTIAENRTGFYLRVLEPGVVQPGDAWILEERFNPDGSIPAINRCLLIDFDPALARRIVQMEGLSDWWKQRVVNRFAE